MCNCGSYSHKSKEVIAIVIITIILCMYNCNMAIVIIVWYTDTLCVVGCILASVSCALDGHICYK